MSSPGNLPPLDNYNGWADFWRYDIGVNVIPADTKNKAIYERWSEWQDSPIPEDLHNKWKREDSFSKGIAVILGKVWHNREKSGLYLNGIDADNLKAIEEICTYNGKNISLKQLADRTLVEQHQDDTNRAHIYIYSHKPFAKKSSDKTIIESIKKIESSEIPAIEVKGEGRHGTLFCSPSIHKNGYSYQILGTHKPLIADDFEQLIDNICRKYGISYLDGNGKGKSSSPAALPPIEDLFKQETKIYEGHNRHEALLRAMESLIVRNRSILSMYKIQDLAREWNNDHCVPALDNKEFEKQWKCAVDFITKDGNDKDHASNEEKEKQSKSAAQKALYVVQQHCSELFLDQFGSPYAAVKIAEHIETLPLKSSRFKNWLCKTYYESEDAAILNSENVTSVLNILKARAEFDGTPRNLHLRVASSIPTEPHTIFCDLTNKEWLAVKITENGWTVEYAPIIFKRYSNQQPQVYPSKEYTQDIFDEFMQLINVKGEDNKLLLKCYIISLFYPEIPKPILMLHGEQGSAKSTLQELIKMLVDPSSIRTLTFPRDISELIQKLSHNYIAYFDNMSSITEWISDQLCSAVTGSGFSKRELYSDDDDIIYNFKRCIGLNGINLAATKADLLDRGIIVELERITKDKIRKVEEIWQDFEKIKPQLLGYIFDILVKVLHVKRSGGIEINGLPRMADFAEIGEIISRCMGYEDNKFLDAYYKNIDLQVQEAIEANPVGTAIVKLMEGDDKLKWTGTATELLSELDQIADELKINTNSKLWPKASNYLRLGHNSLFIVLPISIDDFV